MERGVDCGGPASVVFDPSLTDYDFGIQHPMSPVRVDLTMRLAAALGVTGEHFPLVPAPIATDEQVATVHDPELIEAIKRAGTDGTPDLTRGLGSDDNPIFPGMHDNAALIAGGSIDAARAIARGEVDRAVNFCGGLHHAMPDHASGFCVYNDAALAIKAMLREGVERVAYIDVDAHHGDGVQAAFYDDPRVLTVSLHESPLTLFPGTGWATEVGVGRAQGTAVNVALPAGTADAAWLRAFHAVVPGVVRAFRPEVLVTQQGADGHREDPLADLMLTVDGQRTTYVALRELAREITGGRWLALGGGGYSPVRVVPRAWTHLLAVVAEKDLAPATPMPEEWIAQAAQARPDVPLPIDMSDGEPGLVAYVAWAGHQEMAVDRAILETRDAVFPLHGLDPRDPRD